MCPRIEDIDGPSNLLSLRSLVLLPLGRIFTWQYFRPELVILQGVFKVKRGREIERSLPRLSKAAGSEPFVCICRMRELWGSLEREDMEKVLPRVGSSAWECCKCQMLHSSFLVSFFIAFQNYFQNICAVYFLYILLLPSKSVQILPTSLPTHPISFTFSKNQTIVKPHKRRKKTKKVKKEKSNPANLSNNEGTRKTWSPCCTASVAPLLVKLVFPLPAGIDCK